jgi:type III secretion protein J
MRCWHSAARLSFVRLGFVRLGLVLGTALLLSACQSDLYGGLNEDDANEMLAILIHDGLAAAKVRAKDGTTSIFIDQAQFATAVDVLKAHGLPRTKFATINDVFQPSGLIASPMQEQARYIWAIGQELSKTVSQIDGVLTARVQVVLPDNDLMKREVTPSSASVFIRYDEGSQASALVSQIKSLVANSVQGLTYEKVSVTLVPVPHVAPPPVPPPAPAWQVPAASAAAAALLLALVWWFRGAIGGLLARTRPSAPEAAE